MNNKGKALILKIALLLSAFVVQADPMILQPNLSSLQADFPTYSYSIISMIMTVSSGFLAVTALSTGKVASAVGKKKLLLIGTILFTVGGVATGFAPTFALIIVTRAIEGLGAGFVITLSMILIPELFDNEKDVNILMGLNGVATAIFGALISTVSGYMGVKSWRIATYLYLVGIIILVIQIIAIPSDKQMKEKAIDVPKGKITGSAISVAILAFLFAVVTTIFMSCMPNFVVEAGIGDTSNAGIIMSVMTIGSFIIGFAFSKLFSTLKLLTPAVSYILMALAVVLPLAVPSFATAAASAFIFGCGYGTYFPYINAETARISAPENLDSNMSLVNGLYYLGMFASSYLMIAIGKISGDDSSAFYFKFMVVAFIIFVIYYLIVAIKNRATAKA